MLWNLNTTSKDALKIHWYSDIAQLVELFDQVVEMDRTFFPTPWSSEQWRRLIGTGEREFLLGVLSGGTQHQSLMGFILFFTDKVDSFAHLVKIVIHPDHCRKGLAAWLFYEFVARGRNEVDRVYLEVEAANNAAYSLYKKLGFKELRVLRDFYGQNRDGIGMLYLSSQDD